MRTTFTNVDREFTPGEAASITGVSGDLQRDWRRRGILPENRSGKWTRFSLTHIIRMSVMKAFSDAGTSVLYIADFADMATLPTLSRLYELPGAVVFEGDEVSDKLKLLHVTHSIVGARGRYLVVARDVVSGQPQIARFGDLEGLDGFLAEHGAIHFTVLDCERLADTIAARAGLPLMRVEVERSTAESTQVSPP